MSLDEREIAELEARLAKSQAAVRVEADLEVYKRDWLAKGGVVRNLFTNLKDVPPDQKAVVAGRLNQIKISAEEFFTRREQEFRQQKLEAGLANEFYDFSLPSAGTGLGKVHPVRLVDRQIEEILRPFGFRSVVGPEVESEYYCFDALNIPKHHPARDMQDTFYTESGHVLRTHTTSIQARELQKGGLPVKIVSFGRVYRNETEDPTHQAMFHQFELVWLEKGMTLSHLMALITHVLKAIYGKRRKVRFVPKFYPYTEPSIGPQIDCLFCKGAGCNACVYSGWSTVGGAGMIHRNVLKEFGYDPSEVSGFAFGMGSTKLATQRFETPTMKILYDNDLRVLKGL